MRKLAFEYFFARRIVFHSDQRAVSILVIWLATISIALAVATMEIAISVKNGFEREIQNKVAGFGAHLQIGNYLSMMDTEVKPLPRSLPEIITLDTLPYVLSVSPYVLDIGLYKSDIMEDIWLKGVDSSYQWDFMEQSLTAGRIPVVDSQQPSLEILISVKQSQRFELTIGDKLRLYFVKDLNDVPRIRPMTVVGIYETGMQEFDNKWAFCDMRVLQKLWDLGLDEVLGFEVNLTDLSNLQGATEAVNDIIPIEYAATPINERFPEIFGWLSMIRQNVQLIFVLMYIVAIINMTTVILILIIERTRTIGILQTLGLTRTRIRRVFVFQAFFLIFIGVLIGNLVGLGLLYSQDIWGWLKLGQENYYLKEVPVEWLWDKFLWINLGIILVCTLAMYLPTWMISRITPVEAIRFE